MLGSTNVVAMVAVRDLAKAKAFYGETLGLTQSGSQDEEVVSYTSGASMLWVYRSEFAGTNKATAAAWDVGSGIGDVVKTLKGKGVPFEHYDMPGLTLQGDVHSGNGMKVAWFKDPDGNILSIVGK